MTAKHKSSYSPPFAYRLTVLAIKSERLDFPGTELYSKQNAFRKRSGKAMWFPFKVHINSLNMLR